MEKQKSVSRLIIVLSVIIALMELLVSAMLIFSPASVADQVDLGAQGADYLIYMWAARQFALGVIFAYAAFRRSASMLTIAWLFLLVMMVGDIIIGIIQKQYGMVGGAAVMALVAASMMLALNRKNKNDGLQSSKIN